MGAPDPRSDTLLMVFARAPRLGEVKTRLAPALGDQGALAVYQRLLDRTLTVAAGHPGPARLMLDRDDPALAGRAEALGLTVGRQRGADLGERMARALAEGLSQAPRVLLVGCDCPVLDQTYLALADDHLRRRRVVLGASEDGGFVLIGGSDATVWRPDRFNRVRLGGAYALADTLVALNDVALNDLSQDDETGVAVLPPLWDVDHPEDVARARQLGVLP